MENNNSDHVIDLTYLMQVSNGDDGFIKEMIRVYLKETPEAVNNLEKHLKNKNWDMLRAVIHKMKPSFSFFGLKGMDATVNSIEEYSAKKINLEMLPEMIAKVKDICTKAIEELKEKKSFSVIN